MMDLNNKSTPPYEDNVTTFNENMLDSITTFNETTYIPYDPTDLEDKEENKTSMLK